MPDRERTGDARAGCMKPEDRQAAPGQLTVSAMTWASRSVPAKPSLELLRSLDQRGLRGLKLVTSDSHEGLRAAAPKMLKAIRQRCRMHFMRTRWRWPSRRSGAWSQLLKLAACMDEAEHNVLAIMDFPRAHWTQMYSANPLGRLMPRSNDTPMSWASSPS